jgi:hypothetical protein
MEWLRQYTDDGTLRRIALAFAIEGSREQPGIVTLRKSGETVSVTAHGKSHSVELIVDNTKTVLIETNSEVGRLIKTTLSQDGEVERTSQKFDVVQGVVGHAERIELPSPDGTRRRITRIREMATHIFMIEFRQPARRDLGGR